MYVLVLSISMKTNKTTYKKRRLKNNERVYLRGPNPRILYIR